MSSNRSSPQAPPWDFDKERALPQLAQVLSHRLRGLVTSIQGFTDLLMDTLDTAEQKDLAGQVIEGTALIEEVLAGLQHYSTTPSVRRRTLLVHDVLTDLFVALDDREVGCIVLNMQVSQTRTIKADPLLLGQALQALLHNALEATPQHGRIELTVTESQQAIQFNVWNEGPLATDEPIEVLFMPFFTTKAHNTGLGLTLAQRIAHLHGGSLHLVTHSAEEGILFSLALPCTPEDTS